MSAGDGQDPVTSDGTQEVEFGYRGVAYRACLSAAQAAELDRLMSVYIEAGRAESGGRARMRLVR